VLHLDLGKLNPTICLVFHLKKKEKVSLKIPHHKFAYLKGFIVTPEGNVWDIM